MKSITIQPAPSKEDPLKLPYPYHIEPITGNVGRQDFWKGKPAKLQGFNPKPVAGVIKGTIGLEDFFKKPERAIGMYPIFEHKGGDFFTHFVKIESIHKNV